MIVDMLSIEFPFQEERKMNGFNNVLKFRVWGSFQEARTIADDIIMSLVKNSGLKEEEKDYLPTYTSTIKESFLCWIGDIGSSENKTENETGEDKYISQWIIRIYEVNGNRGSRLSVTQNKELRDIVCQ